MRGFGGRLLLGFVALVIFPLLAVPSACVVREEDDEHEDEDEGDDDGKKSDGAAKGGPRIPATPGAAGAGSQSDAAELDANALVDATESEAAPDPFANPCARGLHPYRAPTCAAKAHSRCFDSVTFACLCECGTEPCLVGIPCGESSPVAVYPWQCAPVVSCGYQPDAGSVDASVSDAASDAPAPLPSSTAPAPPPSSADAGRHPKFRIPPKPVPSG